MASYRCKKCRARNTIPKEWIELGISRIVHCSGCGNKMNLNLEPKEPEPKSGTVFIDSLQDHNHKIQQSEKGTHIETDLSSEKNTNTYSLEVIEGKKQTIEIDIAEMSETHHMYLGRNPASKQSMNDNDISWIIDDPYVSRLHCQLTIMKQAGKAKFVLQDSLSANGTEVNQNKLEENDQILLNVGDKIMIGDTKIVLKKN